MLHQAFIREAIHISVIFAHRFQHFYQSLNRRIGRLIRVRRHRHLRQQ
jgi:hypothetical protein